MLSRRALVVGQAAVGAVGMLPRSSFAQSPRAPVEGGWPNRPVRVIIPSGAGGPAENFRVYADHLHKVFGQSFVHENQPGAAGAIGSAFVARAPADGYTLLCPANSHVVLAPLVAQKRSFDVQKDFDPIALCLTYPFCMIVNADLPIRDVPELVAYAKANPGKLNFGSIGIGTGGHLVTELFRKRAGVDAVHVPYTGAPAQVMGVSSGALQFTVDTIGNSRGAVAAGKVRQIAVTGAKRAAAAPDVPTFAEQGFPGFEMQLWIGLIGPKGTPAPIVAALNEEINRCGAQPDVKARLNEAAYEPAAGSPQDFATLIAEELRTWGQIVAETGIHTPG